MIVAQEFVNGARAVQLASGDDGFTSTGKTGVGWKAALKAAFLPEGWPDSVSADYLAFQLWDTVQGLSSYVRGMLSSQAILVGVGVGKEAATPLNAVFQFFVRDLAGMLGGILFASSQGSGLDSYAKQWRIFADCLNNLGMAIELASPLLPGAFLLLACLGSVARAVTGVAGGATRTALTLHFARQRNAADIAAKEGSQETAATMVGMILGMGVIRLTAGSAMAAWTVFVLMTWLHIFANIRALRCLHMTSLNRPRLDLLLTHYWAKVPPQDRGQIWSPADLAGRETLLAPPLQRLAQRMGLQSHQQPPITVAPTLSSLSRAGQQQLAEVLVLKEVQGIRQRYLVLGSRGRSRGSRPSFDHLLVLLRPGAETADILRAYCVALLAGKGLLGHEASATGTCATGWQAIWPTEIEERRLEALVAGLPAAGWAVDRLSLLQGDSRVAWGPDLHGD
ncbi:hypothetical protein N2152v2_009280 [Parachlorella kessleri]